MTSENKQTLIEDLKQFGLNPKDWALKRIGKLRFQLQHRKDPDFTLIGQGEYLDSQPKWAKIQIISI